MLDVALLVFALICFVLAALNVRAGVNLVALGLAAATLALLV